METLGRGEYESAKQILEGLRVGHVTEELTPEGLGVTTLYCECAPFQADTVTRVLVGAAVALRGMAVFEFGLDECRLVMSVRGVV